MKRLTTDAPDGNFETMLNLVFGKDGWAHIRHDGEEGSVSLTQWAKAQCILHGCGEFSAETPQEIDEEISDCLMMDFSDCPIALAYGFATQACHLRDRLKMYEDIFFAENGTERISLDDLQALAESAEKRKIMQRLKDYRAAHGLGSLLAVSVKSSHFISQRVPVDTLRNICIDRAPRMDMSEWRKITRALDILEVKNGNNH